MKDEQKHATRIMVDQSPKSWMNIKEQQRNGNKHPTLDEHIYIYIYIS